MAKQGNFMQSALVVGSAIFAGYMGYDYYKKHQAVQANNMRIRIAGVHMQNDGTINMDLQVMNPNSAGFSFKSILGDLLVNNTKVADLKMFGDYTVRPNDQATIPVMAKIQSMNLFAQLVQKLKGKKLAVSFTGTINVNDKAIPLTMQYSV